LGALSISVLSHFLAEAGVHAQVKAEDKLFPENARNTNSCLLFYLRMLYFA
jgi:hypothetical protein